MRFFAGKGAKKVITVWISALGIAATALVSALAGLTTPRLLPLAFVFGAATVAAAFWSPLAMSGGFRSVLTAAPSGAVSGVLAEKGLFVPADAIRAFGLLNAGAKAVRLPHHRNKVCQRRRFPATSFKGRRNSLRRA